MKIKTYDIIRFKNGYQVIWFWGGSYINSGLKAYDNYVKDGWFLNRCDAESHANNLQLEITEFTYE